MKFTYNFHQLFVFLLFLIHLDPSIAKKEDIPDGKTPQFRFSYAVGDTEESDSEDEDIVTGSQSSFNPKSSYGYRKSPVGEYRLLDYLSDEYSYGGQPHHINEPSASSSNPANVKVKTNAQYESMSIPSSTAEPLSPSANSNSNNNNNNNNGRKPAKLIQTESEDEIEQKPEKVVEDPESGTTPGSSASPAPAAPASTQSPFSTKGSSSASAASSSSSSSSVSSSSSSGSSSNKETNDRENVVYVKPAKDSRKALAAKISIHQLISEAMPSLQMSVVPVYFMNKATKSLMTIPYLVMRSTSKMPLLPGMFEGVNGVNGGSSGNLLNYHHNSAIRGRYRSNNQLLPFLANSGSTDNYGSHPHREPLRSNERETESEAGTSWVPVHHGQNLQEALW